MRGLPKETQAYKKQKEKSDNDTVITDNRSRRSVESDDAITEVSQETVKTKVIMEMREMMKKMQEDHMKMMNHIKLMEDAVISLAEESANADSFESAIEMAKKLKKKRKREERKARKTSKEMKKKAELRRLSRLSDKATKVLTKEPEKEEVPAMQKNQTSTGKENVKGLTIGDIAGIDCVRCAVWLN